MARCLIDFCAVAFGGYFPHPDALYRLEQIDFAVDHDEELLEFEPTVPDEIAKRVGSYVARIVQDGDTIQVGYGSLPNAILGALGAKRHLGVHTELLTDGIVDLVRRGVVDNSRKTEGRGKTVARFCMGRRVTYEFIHETPPSNSAASTTGMTRSSSRATRT